MVKIHSIGEFVEHTLQLDTKLREYALSARGRRVMRPAVFEDLVDRARGRLMSANAAARIAFACEAETHLRRILDPSRARQAFHVTLNPSFGIRRQRELDGTSYVNAAGEWRERRKSFEPVWRQVQSWASRTFAGHAFIGMIEVAFFRTHPQSATHGSALCFHAHMVVWGRPRMEVEELCAALNTDDRPFIPNLNVAHVGALNTIDRAVEALIYASKPPVDEYKAIRIDDAPDGSDRWKTRKAALRPGDAARTAAVFAGVEIDQLAFDGGAALGAVKTISAAARERLQWDETEAVRAVEARRRGFNLAK